MLYDGNYLKCDVSCLRDIIDNINRQVESMDDERKIDEVVGLKIGKIYDALTGLFFEIGQYAN